MDAVLHTVIAGRYRIECEIGRGGMGTVYRATHLGLVRPVAVKILKPEFAASPEVTERFMREARTMARLRHSRAAIIFDAGKLDDNRPFIVMEFVEGVTLAEALAREGRFAPERAVRVAAEVCDVLAEAHRLGIVHRDLKPSNIMLTERGVCVLDFGIAKILQTSAEATAAYTTTDSALIIGTPRYMSPEQCVGHRVGPSSDLYSLGVVLYEMLAGRPPFMDVLQSAVLVKQAIATAPLLLALQPELPRALALVVHGLLAKNPAHRPKSAQDSRLMLQRSIVENPLNASGSDETPFATTTTQLTNASRFGLHRIAATIVILAMCSVVLFALAHNLSGDSASAFDDISSRAHAQTIISSSDGARRAPQSGALSLPPSALTLDAARMLAANASHGTASSANVVRMLQGAMGVVAVNRRLSQDRERVRTAYLFVMEQQEESHWRVTRRVSLDAENFRSTQWTTEVVDWTTEVVDADGDGYDEVICAGSGTARGRGERTRRFVLYVPRTQRTYSLEVTPDGGASNILRAVWSPNAQTHTAAPFRAALQQRALAVGLARRGAERQRSF